MPILLSISLFSKVCEIGEKKTDENGFSLIGPHVGRELELMLSGQKPMAKFTIEEGMEPKYCGVEFEP